jgi:hypothetical protein
MQSATPAVPASKPRLARLALLAHDPSGHYYEQMRFGYTVGRKPT